MGVRECGSAGCTRGESLFREEIGNLFFVPESFPALYPGTLTVQEKLIWSPWLYDRIIIGVLRIYACIHLEYAQRIKDINIKMRDERKELFGIFATLSFLCWQAD